MGIGNSGLRGWVDPRAVGAVFGYDVETVYDRACWWGGG